MMLPGQIATEQIWAELAFLEYHLARNCHVDLRAGEGLSLVMENSKAYLNGTDQSDTNLRAIHALLSLCGSLRGLWFKAIPFCQQLKSMNSGGYNYGVTSGDGRNYKDFEFELFTASMMARSGLQPTLPKDTLGNDVFCDGIEIQCKQPDSIKGIGKYLDAFTSSLNKNKSYGIMAVAVEDAFLYDSKSLSAEVDFNQWHRAQRAVIEPALQNIFENALAAKTRILGVVLTATHFIDYPGANLNVQLLREVNSVFCFRPDRDEIKDEHYRNAYRILSCFNTMPSMLTFHSGKLISTNTKPV